MRKNKENIVSKAKEAINDNNKGMGMKYNQAAVEEEHVVIRGSNKGKNVIRTVVDQNAKTSMMAIGPLSSICAIPSIMMILQTRVRMNMTRKWGIFI